MNELIPYEKIYRIELNFSESVYFITEKQYENLQRVINSAKFIDVGNSLIAVSSIKRIFPDDSGVGYVPDNLREAMKCEIEEYKKNFGKYPTRGVIANMLKALSKTHQ